MSAPAAPRKPRKTATRTAKSTSTSSSRNGSAPRVALDLDAMTKNQALPGLKLPTAPFDFLHAGVTYVLNDPRDVDWKMSVTLAGNPFLLLRHCLTDADEPVDDPTDDEIRTCRDRHGLPMEPPEPGSEDAEKEAKDWPDGPPKPALIDRFTASNLPGWKLNTVYEQWHKYYKISPKGLLAAMLGADSSADE